ncbi:MAG: hypothetical protein M0Z33_02120 [Actinomycetota bacterium]|nr:hypothetical protein [Actinomycetota bacterium]
MSTRQVSKHHWPRGCHPCPARACGEQIAFHMLACRRHWHRLPRDLRALLVTTWKTGDLTRYVSLREEAIAWLRRK